MTPCESKTESNYSNPSVYCWRGGDDKWWRCRDVEAFGITKINRKQFTGPLLFMVNEYLEDNRYLWEFVFSHKQETLRYKIVWDLYLESLALAKNEKIKDRMVYWGDCLSDCFDRGFELLHVLMWFSSWFFICLNEWRNERMDEWMKKWMNEWKNDWMKVMSSLIYKSILYHWNEHQINLLIVWLLFDFMKPKLFGKDQIFLIFLNNERKSFSHVCVKYIYIFYVDFKYNNV